MAHLKSTNHTKALERSTLNEKEEEKNNRRESCDAFWAL